MPDRTAAHDRLQPALLDRLTDYEPDRRLEPREERVLSRTQLRQAVRRDLEWLFNSTRLETGQEMARAPFVRRSVVNFGVPSLSGRLASTLEVTDLERGIRQAILDFEPRILPDTLSVSAITETTYLDHHNVIGVQIQGQLWSEPVPIDLLIRTEIDLETGKVHVADLVSRRGV